MVRRVQRQRTRVAGPGGDGELYGVASLNSSGGGREGYRRQVCATCPWRLDAEVGRFPAQAFRLSAPTAYDAAMATFACHESGSERPQTCAGFLAANAVHNLGVRLAQLRGDYDPTRLRVETPLFGSYREMAEANGVAADDPVLAGCRGNEDP